MNIKSIDDFFNIFKQIREVLINIFGLDISIIILKYYNLQLVKNIKLYKNNRINLNEDEIIKNYSVLVLYNLSDAEYYSKTEEYDKFDGDTRINEFKIIGKFKTTPDEIIIMGKVNSSYTTYKMTYDEDGKYNCSEPTESITTIKFSKQELCSYTFD